MPLMSAACRANLKQIQAAEQAARRTADPRHRVEVRHMEVVAYFPASTDAAYLTPDLARCWAEVLTKAAEAAEMLASIGVAADTE